MGFLFNWGFTAANSGKDRSIVFSGVCCVKQDEGDGNKQISTVHLRQKTSKAMKAYLERAEAHQKFMKKESYEYNIGKRHLANIMGRDVETFTQKDIDESIAYLFPSGLFVPSARPLMKEPHEIFPAKKEAEFDESGRPFHYLFYTGRPNFYSLLHEMAETVNELNEHQNRMVLKQLPSDTEDAMNVSMEDSQWIFKEDLEKKLVEEITVAEYDSFVTVMERLATHPYAFRIKDKLLEYRKPLIVSIMNFDPPEPLYDEKGVAYWTTKDCPRKSARADVTVRHPGTGIISINGQDLSYFKETQPREQILFPLLFTEMLGKVDVEATVTGGGPSGQAGAVRWGIAWGLRLFVDKDMLEEMRLAGLLTKDFRHRERKKPGQAKARKKFTWKKR